MSIGDCPKCNTRHKAVPGVWGLPGWVVDELCEWIPDIAEMVKAGCMTVDERTEGEP